MRPDTHASQTASLPDPQPAPMRASVRFPLHLPVVLNTGLGPVHAITEDISSTGACFLAQAAPAVGSTLQWNLHLPASIMGTPTDVEVECVGRVIWAHIASGGIRVGALIDDYQLKEERP